MSADQTYIGQELTIFAHAKNWKKYYTSIIRPFFGNRVVEVGAGIGATTAIMCSGIEEEWICLEPDPELRNEIDKLIAAGQLPACCRTMGGFITGLVPENPIDTVIYIDVLEHIENDRAELETAAALLRPRGRLIVLSPAFNLLYSPFDKTIGHFRRYDKRMFRALTPIGCRLERLVYLDSVGALTSLINRFLLAQSMPTIEQINFWDKWIIPTAKWIDRLIGYRAGRSILGIWLRE